MGSRGAPRGRHAGATAHPATNSITSSLAVLLAELDTEVSQLQASRADLANRCAGGGSAGRQGGLLLRMQVSASRAPVPCPIGRRLNVMESLVDTVDETGRGSGGHSSNALGGMFSRLHRQKSLVGAELADVDRRLAVLRFARQEWQSMLDLMRGEAVAACV